METYVNLDTVIRDDLFEVFKDSITCPLCLNILIEPIICMKCQKVYCKKCIEKWKKKNSKCPSNCNPPNYQDCLGKKDILSILSFKCKKCGQSINYFDAKKHHNICCPDNVSKNIKLEEETEVEEIVLKQMEKISQEEVESYKKKGIRIKNIKSKNNNLYFKIFNIVLVLGNSGVGKTNLIQK
jgi:hypothetical protein